MVTLVVGPAETAVNHAPAANTQATISSETPNAGEQIIVKAFTATLTAVATPPASELQVVLRDGAAGAGAIKWSGFMMVAANGFAVIDLEGLSIPMTPGNVATLEFTAAGGLTTREAVSLIYTRGGVIG